MSGRRGGSNFETSGWRRGRASTRLGALGLALALLPLAGGTARAQDDAGLAVEEDTTVVEEVPVRVEVVEDDDAFEEAGDFELVFEDVSFDELEAREDLSLATRYSPYLHYNRVDQWAIGVELGFTPRLGWLPRWRARVAHTFNRGNRWLYVLRVAQPVISRRRVEIGAEVRRFTDHFDGDRVGSGENFLAAVWTKFDYRDYFEREGVSFFVEAEPLPRLATRLAWVSHDHRSTPEIARGTWSIFRNDEDWRANPAIDEGRLQSLTWLVRLDGLDDPLDPRRGANLELGLESASDDLDSDFTFTRYHAEARGYWAMTRGMDAKARVRLGTTGVGTLPFQKDFAVGGISTLRAHPYKHHRGDHVFLANLEYRVRLWRGRQRAGIKSDVRLLAFWDAGQAWDGDTYDLGSRQLMHDAGLGLSLSEDRVRVYAAQDLRNDDLEPHWTIRLSSPF